VLETLDFGVKPIKSLVPKNRAVLSSQGDQRRLGNARRYVGDRSTGVLRGGSWWSAGVDSHVPLSKLDSSARTFRIGANRRPIRSIRLLHAEQGIHASERHSQ
jgi:hypothetical protein